MGAIKCGSKRHRVHTCVKAMGQILILLMLSTLVLSCRSSISYYVRNTTDRPAVVEVLTVDHWKPDTLPAMYLTLHDAPLTKTAYKRFEIAVKPVRAADGTYLLDLPPHSTLWLVRHWRNDFHTVRGISIPMDSITLSCDTFPFDPCWLSGRSKWYDIVGHTRCGW